MARSSIGQDTSLSRTRAGFDSPSGYKNTNMKKYYIYLDDVRTPVSKEPVEVDWIVVRSYDEFVSKVEELGLENIQMISLDHDLGDTAMNEYFTNVSPNYTLDYNNIHEKTGYDCAKWLVNHYYDKNPDWLILGRLQKKSLSFNFPTVLVHSANPIGSANIMGYINNFLMNEAQPQTCVRVNIPHFIKDEN